MVGRGRPDQRCDGQIRSQTAVHGGSTAMAVGQMMAVEQRRSQVPMVVEQLNIDAVVGSGVLEQWRHCPTTVTV